MSAPFRTHWPLPLAFRADAPLVNVAGLRSKAERRLPKAVFEYIDGGAFDEITSKRNRADLDALAFDERVMVDVETVNTASTMLGDRATMPLALAPVGMAGLAWPNGEIEAAREAERFGVPFCLSCFSISSIEDVAAALGHPFWQQLYMMRDDAVNESVIRRAHAAGCSALVLTLDVHVHSQRWADNRNGLVSPPEIMPSNVVNMMAHLPWLSRMLGSKRRTFATMAAEAPQARNVLELAAWINNQLDPSIDVRRIERVRALWDRKFVLKGILSVADAKRAVDLGADAIIVSNHGGRQLDSAPSTISVLPDIARAVGDQIEVLFDGGVRTGLDILKALGRGAHGCLGGRFWAYGVGAEGGAGVEQGLRFLQQELLDALRLSGETDVLRLRPDLVGRQPAL